MTYAYDVSGIAEFSHPKYRANGIITASGSIKTTQAGRTLESWEQTPLLKPARSP